MSLYNSIRSVEWILCHKSDLNLSTLPSQYLFTLNIHLQSTILWFVDMGTKSHVPWPIGVVNSWGMVSQEWESVIAWFTQVGWHRRMLYDWIELFRVINLINGSGYYEVGLGRLRIWILDGDLWFRDGRVRVMFHLNIG